MLRPDCRASSQATGKHPCDTQREPIEDRHEPCETFDNHLRSDAFTLVECLEEVDEERRSP